MTPLGLIFSISAVFLSIFLIIKSKKGTQENFFLALMLLCIAHVEFIFFLANVGYLDKLKLLVGSDYVALALFGPVFYFYILSMTGLRVIIRKHYKHLIIIIPSLLSYAWFQFQSEEQISDYLKKLRDAYSLLEYVLNFLYSIIIVAYFYVSFLQIIKYQKKISNFFSNLNQINLQWLKNFLIFFLISFSFTAIFLNFQPANRKELLNEIFGMILLSIYCGYIFYKTLTHPAISMLYGESIGIEFNQYKGNKTIAKISLREAQGQYNAMVRLMNEKKMFLNKNYTVFDLAQQMKLPPDIIIQVIASIGNTTFYGFINKFRAKHAKKIMNDGILDLDVLVIKSGFSSKKAMLKVLKDKSLNSYS